MGTGEALNSSIRSASGTGSMTGLMCTGGSSAGEELKRVVVMDFACRLVEGYKAIADCKGEILRW